MEYTLRKAIPSDITEIINLCAEHSEYERADYSSLGKAEKLASFLFSNKPPLFCLIVESDSKILGYATYMFEFSTWDAEYYIYMDCLYLRPAYRGTGIGQVLVEEIEKHSKSEGIKLMQWHTPSFNERAIKFYHRIGGTSKEKFRFYYPVK
jgi:ribosomal protein S18 acetylase RimI-like enzyme